MPASCHLATGIGLRQVAGPLGLRRHRHGPQRGAPTAALLHRLRQLCQRVAPRPGLHGLQARAGEHALEAFGHGGAAAHAGRLLAGRLLGAEAQGHAGGTGEAVERFGQRAGRDVEGPHGSSSDGRERLLGMGRPGTPDQEAAAQ